MRRDFDLIRAILLDVEKRIPAVPAALGYRFEHDDRDAVAFAIYLMAQRGLIDAMRSGELGKHESDTYLHLKLTWEGCDLLDTIRDDEIWRKTKEGVALAGGFTFDLIKSLAKGLVKKQIEKHTGIELNL